MDLPQVAFKEWAAIVLALERGLQDIVLRRGGINEERDAFEASHDSFLLFPTYWHQQREGLRPEFDYLVDEALAIEPPPGRVRLTSWAEVTDVRLLSSEAELVELQTRHVYRPSVPQERLRGAPGRALHVLSVRVHRLSAPHDLPIRDEQRGCRSWVPLPPDHSV